jgi:hypothetical protein
MGILRAMSGDWVRRGFPVPDEPLRLMSGNPAPHLVHQTKSTKMRRVRLPPRDEHKRLERLSEERHDSRRGLHRTRAAAKALALRESGRGRPNDIAHIHTRAP